MTNYSIIIPYRDQLDLLNKALCTIPDRNDIQVIVVDNSIIPLNKNDVQKKEMAQIEIYTSDPTKGAGRARNEGLKHVRGRYTYFCDGDDYFTPNAFDSFDKYLESQYDIVFFCATSIRLLTGEMSKRHELTNSLVHHYIETGDEDSVRYGSGAPWCKLFLSEFIKTNNFKFGETRVSNDLLFSLYSGHAAKRICGDVDEVYVVTEGESNESLTKMRNPDNQFMRYQLSIEKFLFLESVGKKKMGTKPWIFIFQAWEEFGLKEAYRYYKYTKDRHVDVFWGLNAGIVFTKIKNRITGKRRGF